VNEKPNIVFIHTDQQRGDCLGCEGHPVLETPTMDNLACNGVRFSSFYAGCPVCVAARRSILTGQSPQKHGIISNANREIPHTVATLPGELRRNGYQTYHVGRDFHQHLRRKLYGFDDGETDGKHKYVWDPRHGWELFFNLKADPGERHNLAANNHAAHGEVARWRERLVGELSDRPEGFVKAGRLQTVSAYGGVIPWETAYHA